MSAPQERSKAETRCKYFGQPINLDVVEFVRAGAFDCTKCEKRNVPDLNSADYKDLERQATAWERSHPG